MFLHNFSKGNNNYSIFLFSPFNLIAIGTAKTGWSFGCFECNMVNDEALSKWDQFLQKKFAPLGANSFLYELITNAKGSKEENGKNYFP